MRHLSNDNIKCSIYYYDSVANKRSTMRLLEKILVISTTAVLSYGDTNDIVDDFPIYFAPQCKEKFNRTIYDNLGGNLNFDPLIYGIAPATLSGNIGMHVFRKFLQKKKIKIK